MKEAALQWLLRREGAEKLGYFQDESIRFDVTGVIKVSTRDETWRLVECEYLSRRADRSGHTEFRARWQVAYVFDAKGRLRDWVNDYDVAVLRDINGDGLLELAAYLDSPKRVIVQSFEPGRSRKVLRVDDVPERGELLARTPGKEGRVLGLRKAAKTGCRRLARRAVEGCTAWAVHVGCEAAEVRAGTCRE